ncbi:hypothetical protein MRB53_032863 [Persea americana]|uniref:Uncharacterized protein n=1 Tax=Persea americana TaxID=3435 RepID=A0ACC2KT97_PERAE|nr:hypothetical protein MRB53_032863 [Persea americana]
MKNDGEIKSNSRHETSKSAKEKILSPRASRNSKLQDRDSVLKLEKPIKQSHADQRPEAMENTNDRQKKQSKNATEDEELVKFMSDLPCYLQRTGRGCNIQEKALNFGVLDWKRLERWKYEQKKVFGGRNVHSSSSSSYDLSSTFGSSTNSVESACETSALPPKKQFPTLDFYLNLSAKEDHSKVPNGRTSGQHTASNDLKTESRRDQSIGRQHRRSEHEKNSRNDLGSKAILHDTCQTSENALSNLKDHPPLACAKGKMKARDGESKSRAEQIQESGLHLHDENCVNGLNTYEFLSIREYAKDESPDSCLKYGPSAFHDVRTTEINRKVFSGEFHFEFTLSPDVPHSCPFPCNSQSREWPETKAGTSVDLQDTKTSSNVHHSCADSGEMPITMTKDQHGEQKNHSITRSASETLNGLGPIKEKTPTETTKNLSPGRCSTSSLNNTARSFSFREVSDAQQVNSTFTPITLSNSSNRDKASSSNRAKSSPLRRMLDPLLKPKASKHLSSDNLLSGSHEDDGTRKHESNEVLTSTDGFRSPNAVSNCCPSVKRNLNFSARASTDTHEKHVGLKKHARLQLACKNGQPLFTFTVNGSDILAAMMRKVYVSEKNDFEWVYTFYSVHEVKKNKRWINQGSKRKWRGYASNVVGQMKISCSQCHKLTGDDVSNHVMAREFVLFGAELKQAADDTLDFLPSSELTAIIIMAPEEKENHGCARRQSNSSHMKPATCFPQECDSCYLVENKSHSSILVILPGGVHSQPATAVPSTLIHRWRTGGSCDCGGWDEGCALRILTSQGQGSNSLSSSHACCFSNETLHVDLFVQGGSQENRPVFNLSFFKEGLYAIDFNASISLLQAFSICVAILHGGKPANLSEMLNMLETKSSPDSESIENDIIKAPNKSQGENPTSRSQGGIPTSYVPYPPHSPVGRV